jgi:hypothetical protein
MLTKLAVLCLTIAFLIESNESKSITKRNSKSKSGYVYGEPEQIHLSYGSRPDQMVVIHTINKRLIKQNNLTFMLKLR